MAMNEHRTGGGRLQPPCAPLLRMPPFPGGQPRGGPVYRARACGTEDIASATLIADQLVRARVGGAFWRSATDASRARKARSASTVEGMTGHDPWPRIATGAPIAATIADEIAWLAAAADCPVVHPGTGEALDRAALLGELHRHIVQFDYLDPWTGTPISIARWIEILGEWRALLDQNREIVAAYGIAAWKRPVIAQFLWSGGPRSHNRTSFSKLPAGSSVAVWPSRVTPARRQEMRAAGHHIAQIEDGFLRSVGLGVRLNPPFSIVVDRCGIYYDPRTPSDLEKILCEAELGPELCARAARLIAFLNQHRITKYNAGAPQAESLPAHRRKVLVPGQVSDDRSVALGRADVSETIDLLSRVRAAEPDAFIVYKPHPDVVSGLRRGHVETDKVQRYADQIIADVSMDSLLAQVDAVHVLSSLTGFEALLRGCEVVTHGHPFYAGWGLTRDLAPPIERRRRQLTLEQLAAAVLILYPRYLDPLTRLPCPPEILAERLATGQREKQGFLQRLRHIQGKISLTGRRFAEHRQ